MAAAFHIHYISEYSIHTTLKGSKVPMPRIRKQRDIIDRKSLAGKLQELAGWSGYSAKTRPDVLGFFKGALAQGDAEIRRRFEEEGMTGLDTVRARGFLVDQIIRTLHEFAITHVYPVANPTTGEQLSITATGGYGRGGLAPFSDIDLMFLLPYKQTPHTEQVIEFMLYILWDLGLKVGHATRSIDESLRLAASDLTIRTALLEIRWLSGDKDLFNTFKSRFMNDVVANSGPAYVDEKLAERDDRHARMGDTRYVLEPNIKEGKGGLRDLQTLFWIAKYLYQVDEVKDLVAAGVLTAGDAKKFAKADNFLWTVRCHLHYQAGRAEERITFNVQSALAESMGYADRAGARGVERFMKHYFLVAKDVGDLTRIICAVLEENHKKKRFRLPSLSFRNQNIDGFKIDGDRLTVADESDFKTDPIKLLKLFHVAQHQELDIHPQALRLVTQSLKRINKDLREDAEANRLFLEMLTSDKDPEMTLKRLNEAGVFGKFIPDFGRVVAQMQYDMYHVYTVDEHTIRAIGILHRIEKGQLKDQHPISSRVIHEVQSRRALYVAVLLHDIAKGRGGDHSELGAKVAKKLCPRLGLSAWETETVSWLVLHHLLIPRTAFKRDVNDPQTVRDFAEIVQSPERLRLLTVLTVADIQAVGPNVWNAWKATLLRELHNSAIEFITGDQPDDKRSSRVAQAKEAFRDRFAQENPAAAEAHLNRGYPNYWLMFDTDTHIHHAQLVEEAESRQLGLHIETRVDTSRDITELIIYTADHPGLFARIAGAMALGGATIADAKIMTLTNGMALDTFWVQCPEGGAISSERDLKRLWKSIEDTLEGKRSPAHDLEDVQKKIFTSRTWVFKVPPRVLIDNTASASHTVIEVNGRDRPGFLHDVTAALTRVGLQISSAHVTTYGERVVDVFYVKNVFGLKVEHPDKIEEIRGTLLSAVAPSQLPDKKGASKVVAAE